VVQVVGHVPAALNDEGVSKTSNDMTLRILLVDADVSCVDGHGSRLEYPIPTFLRTQPRLAEVLELVGHNPRAVLDDLQIDLGQEQSSQPEVWVGPIAGNFGDNPGKSLLFRRRPCTVLPGDLLSDLTNHMSMVTCFSRSLHFAHSDCLGSVRRQKTRANAAPMPSEI
jgi:hypothetical protein